MKKSKPASNSLGFICCSTAWHAVRSLKFKKTSQLFWGKERRGQSTNLIQDLSVAGQELGQVFDQLLDALQTSLLHDGFSFVSDGLRDGVSGQILQSSRQVEGRQDPDGVEHRVFKNRYSSIWPNQLL